MGPATPSRSLILAALAVVSLVSFITYGGLSGDPGYREVVAEKGSITSSVLATGRVQPDNRVDVKVPLAGRAEEVLAKEGDRVKKGQVLLRMSSLERASIIDTARKTNPTELAKWEKLLKLTEVVAPVDGIVIQRIYEPGQTFSALDYVFVISDRMIVEAPVDETDIGRLHKDQAANVVLDSYPEDVLSGKITRLSYEAQTVNDVTMYVAKVGFENVPEFVRVGMTANVKVDVVTKHDVTLIPIQALKSTENSIYVLVPGNVSGEPDHREIRTGLSDGRRIEVLEGLSAGDVVLIPTKAHTRTDKVSAFGTIGAGF